MPTSRTALGRGSVGLAAFLGIAFGFAWAFWIPVWLLGIPPSSGVAQAALIAGFFGPAIAAIVVRLVVTREGFADAGLVPDLRHTWRYYVVAWLWPLPVVGAVIGLVVLLGLGTPDFTLGQGGTSAASLAVAYGGLLLGAILWTPFFFAEEFGWRGYLQVRWFRERPLLAAVGTGLVWGVWHFPAALAGLIPNGHGLLSLALLPWYMVWFSILLGWLRARAGSVWVACAAHSANNMILAPLGTVVGLSNGMGDLLLSPTGRLLVIPVGLLCGWIVWSGRVRPVDVARSPGTRAGPRSA